MPGTCENTIKQETKVAWQLMGIKSIPKQTSYADIVMILQQEANFFLKYANHFNH